MKTLKKNEVEELTLPNSKTLDEAAVIKRQDTNQRAGSRIDGTEQSRGAESRRVKGTGHFHKEKTVLSTNGALTRGCMK